ncbi:hypothetical protein N7533_001706 [Penicillium manginii]|uniref:uncharacterized protein n=1 Tax=Penicillium manginii TaxID=203109 RepID=UPI00254734B8|nr:uncharacterized protein N7533_001706 [Penicillium manginii]KAJ5763025.1 hypothetical protein N7533_001706 [Penicillium manginii]
MSLVGRYKRAGQIRDLEEVISLFPTLDNHPGLPQSLNGLAMSLATPNSHPRLPLLLSSLVNELGKYTQNTEQRNGLDVAMQAFRQVVTVTSVYPIARIEPAINDLQLLLKQNDHDSEVFEPTGSTIYCLAFFWLSYASLLPRPSNWQPIKRALQFLEKGQGVILSLLMDNQRLPIPLYVLYTKAFASRYINRSIEPNIIRRINSFLYDSQQRSQSLKNVYRTYSTFQASTPFNKTSLRSKY